MEGRSKSTNISERPPPPQTAPTKKQELKMSYNKVILEGHLTRDVEIRYTQDSKPIANTAIAVSKPYTTATGKKREEVLFVDISFFGRLAEIAHRYTRKGSRVLIDGSLKLDRWTDKNGQAKQRHTVSAETLQMLDTKGGK